MPNSSSSANVFTLTRVNPDGTLASEPDVVIDLTKEVDGDFTSHDTIDFVNVETFDVPALPTGPDPEILARARLEDAVMQAYQASQPQSALPGPEGSDSPDFGITPVDAETFAFQGLL